jgi:hypothetical protein
MGPEFINVISGRSASFTGQLAPERCSIQDAPLALQRRDWASKLSLYQQQTQQLHGCVQIRVHDPSGLAVVPGQANCKVERVNDREVIASGGVCYFPISSVSNFELKYEINPQCADFSRIANLPSPIAPPVAGHLKLAPLDIFGFGGFYVSGDSSGRSPQLKPIGSTALRLTIQPSSTDVRLSTDMGGGTPRWPVVAHPDVHMAAFDIFRREGTSSAVLTTQLFAQNLCTDETKPECRFSFPLGALFQLKQLKSDGRTMLLDQWYSGAIVPAFWQGFLPATREISFLDFREGRRYRLEADLTYMSMNYGLFKEGFKNYLVSLGLLKIDPDQPLAPLRPIAKLPTLKGLIPSAPLPDLKPLTPGGASDVSLELNRMRSLVTDVNWPPLYEKICAGEKCLPALDGQAHLKVGLEFTIDKFENNHAAISDLRVWRESSLLSEYNIQTTKLMRPECK